MNKVNKNHTGARIFRIIVLSALGLFVGLSIYIFNARIILHDPYPKIGDFGFSVVISGSMEPTININDVVITQNQDNYNIDDIVVYVDDNGKSVVIHRIVNINPSGEYVTKGDANNAPDRPVSIDRVQGKMITKISGLSWLFTPLIMYLLGAIIVSLLIVSIFIESRQRHQDKLHQEQLRQQIESYRHF